MALFCTIAPIHPRGQSSLRLISRQTRVIDSSNYGTRKGTIAVSGITCRRWRHSSDSSPDGKEPSHRVKSKQLDRDFFLSVLGANATRRDAKTYLSRFQEQRERTVTSTDIPATTKSQPIEATQKRDTFHLALVKLKLSPDISDHVLSGLTQTLSQIDRLGMTIVIVLDLERPNAASFKTESFAQWRSAVNAKAEQLVSLLCCHRPTRAARLDSCIGVAGSQNPDTQKQTLEVQYPHLLLSAIRKGIIPLVTPVAYSIRSQQARAVDADDVVVCLAKSLAGVPSGIHNVSSMDEPTKTVKIQTVEPRLSLDRIIILDPVGGLPSSKPGKSGHIFVNMEQEYNSIKDELQKTANDSILTKESNANHVKNLELLRNVLSFLPPSSSALLTTPGEAAKQAAQDESTNTSNRPTRKFRNLLIHNLLTDRPQVSSSLPLRDEYAAQQLKSTAALPAPATFVKRGVSLTIIPNPRDAAWCPPQTGGERVSLLDPRVDLSRLLILIEDSFNRPLDIQHYLQRIEKSTAGLIVAGEYEGGAILTWELPPSIVNTKDAHNRMVPYLDKFAVLKRSQGSGGVADIVFSAMVRECFPSGVCWRSRKANPVNKWYFERSRGTWKIPNSNWTMFWTTKDLPLNAEKWLDYVSVCRSVKPSWANREQAAD